MRTVDKVLLRKRFLIETINDQLKNVCRIEHTRHRSPVNLLVNLIAGLLACARRPKKPSLNLDDMPDSNPAEQLASAELRFMRHGRGTVASRPRSKGSVGDPLT